MDNEPEMTCPKCGKDMIVRQRKSDGSAFFGCAGFPQCRETMSIKEAERVSVKKTLSAETRLTWSERIRNRIAKIRRVNYYDYIKSNDWKRKKSELEKSARYRCQVCNKGKDETILNVHHRTYARLGCELPSDLVVLCRACHALYHGKLPSPKDAR